MKINNLNIFVSCSWLCMCVRMKEVHWSFREFVCRCYGCVCRLYLFLIVLDCSGCVCVCVCVEVVEGKKGTKRHESSWAVF